MSNAGLFLHTTINRDSGDHDRLCIFCSEAYVLWQKMVCLYEMVRNQR